MRRARKLSIFLLCISGLLGLIRGCRLIIANGDQTSILFPYPQETLKVSVFSNYFILGWIILALVGFFSILAVAGTVYRIRNYAYLIIMESIFICFLTVMHLLMTHFYWIHLAVLLPCIGLLVLGILQTPREF